MTFGTVRRFADTLIRLGDGRAVQVRVLGAEDGVPVMALHGTPGSRLKFDGADEAARACGVRIISVDRWGYGKTDAPSRPALADYGNDLAGVADALEVPRFGLIGISGGGPFAAMAAGRLGARVTAVALVGPVGPLVGCPLPGTSLFHQLCFRAVPHMPGASRLMFAGFRQAIRRVPELAIAMTIARAPETDRAIMADPVLRRALIETFEAGLETNAIGPAIDMALFSARWRPDTSMAAATRVWLGGADGNISLPAARHLGALMSAEVIEVPDAGHYWIAQHWSEVLGWLAEHHPPSKSAVGEPILDQAVFQKLQPTIFQPRLSLGCLTGTRAVEWWGALCGLATQRAAGAGATVLAGGVAGISSHAIANPAARAVILSLSVPMILPTSACSERPPAA